MPLGRGREPDFYMQLYGPDILEPVTFTSIDISSGSAQGHDYAIGWARLSKEYQSGEPLTKQFIGNTVTRFEFYQNELTLAGAPIPFKGDMVTRNKTGFVYLITEEVVQLYDEVFFITCRRIK